MRIVQLCPVGVIGGAERVMLGCIRVIREQMPGSSVAVVMLAEGPLREAAERAGARVVVVPLPPALAEFGDTQWRSGSKLVRLQSLFHSLILAGQAGVSFLRKLREVLRQLRPDLIHTHGMKAHLVARLARPHGVPVVWHLHDFLSERPVMVRALKLVRRGVAGGIAISDAVKRDTKRVLSGLPITVVRNAVDTEHFAPGDGCDLDVLAGLSTAAPGVIRIGLVATYANWKGHGIFLEAVARLPMNVRGYIIGGPIYATAGSQVTRSELEKQASSLNLKVGFVPFQPDPVNVYRALDIVVHASTRPEPFGLTILEAMSCGKAVVVSAAGGAVELFRDGEDALGHTPGDAANLTAVLDRLVRDSELRIQLGGNARRTAVEHFGIERFGLELAAAYQTVRR